MADLSRRAVLTGCGAACLAVLTGCGGGERPTAAPPTGHPNPTGPPSPASLTGPPSAGSAASAGGTPAGFLARLDDIPVGGGAIVNENVLLVRPAAGMVRAFDAHCPHADRIVGTPDAAGVITCPGHLAHYRAADGSLIDGPSPSGLHPITVRVADGAVLRT